MAAAIVTNPINFGHSALIAHPIAEKMAHTMSDNNVFCQMPDQNIRCISPAHRTVAGFVMGSIFWRTVFIRRVPSVDIQQTYLRKICRQSLI